ncbi:hypothetical protein DPMN_122119 [Dreissena polymorpha]|uniref:Uncharacterized protein n=1 Tax=Dreissena polymorpha TaxID=45954 RepID=A0A9D4GP20_DREPO|nr:hypothetical protein DPMN_122119 [Dreissena polymorpha]
MDNISTTPLKLYAMVLTFAGVTAVDQLATQRARGVDRFLLADVAQTVLTEHVQARATLVGLIEQLQTNGAAKF